MRWVAVFSGEELDPLAYETIPRRALPPGVDVAYFNVNYFTRALPESFYEAVAGTVPEKFQGVDTPPIRDEPFFALNRAGHFVPITNGQACEWLLRLYPTELPTEARFVSIPESMLPPRVRVAWFDAYTFHINMPGWAQRDLAPPARRRRVAARAKAKAKAMPAPSTDTRPLMTVQWCLDNVDEFNRRLRDRPPACPICCNDRYCIGPVQGHGGVHIPTRCAHRLCGPCWGAVSVRDRKCPFCRDDVGIWLSLLTAY
jgi:hypothetical protein